MSKTCNEHINENINEPLYVNSRSFRRNLRLSWVGSVSHGCTKLVSTTTPWQGRCGNTALFVSADEARSSLGNSLLHANVEMES